MKDKPEQSRLESDRIAAELRLAKTYWLKRIYRYIAGRRLQGVELYVAVNAHRRLQAAQKKAEDWNKTNDGKHCPIPAPVLVELAQDCFREPEELCRDENLKPETLAMIATLSVQPHPENLTPIAAAAVAHERLMAAERYIRTLPEQKRGTTRVIEDSEKSFRMVTFAEIKASNRKSSGQLPLLPPVARKRKARDEQELSDEPLSGNAVKNAVKHFYNEHSPHQMVEQDWLEKEKRLLSVENPAVTYHRIKNVINQAVGECLANNQIPLLDLCRLRWERFCGQSQIKVQAATTRKRKKLAGTRKKRDSAR